MEEDEEEEAGLAVGMTQVEELVKREIEKVKEMVAAVDKKVEVVREEAREDLVEAIARLREELEGQIYNTEKMIENTKEDV